jgi:hypothetical protein
MKQFVLDAHALLDFLENGPAAEKVGRLLKDAAAHQQPLLVSVVNWGEVFYLSWQRVGEDRAGRRLRNCLAFPLASFRSIFRNRSKLEKSKRFTISLMSIAWLQLWLC